MNIVTLRMKSKILFTPTEVTILLPENEKSEQERYPVLWFLHGANEDNRSYLYSQNFEEIMRGHEMIVVMPYALNSDFANHMEFGTGYAYADFFFEELMPYVFRFFPASSDPSQNYLAGYSMGGAATLMYALYRPECFGHYAVLGSSVRKSDFLKPYLDWTGEAFRAKAMANPRQFPTEFGDPEIGMKLKEINMISRYPTVRDYVNSIECTWERFSDLAKENRIPSMMFCCGSDDLCCEQVKTFKEYADSLGAEGISYEFIPGYDHNQAVGATIKKAMDYFNI